MTQLLRAVFRRENSDVKVADSSALAILDDASSDDDDEEGEGKDKFEGD